MGNSQGSVKHESRDLDKPQPPPTQPPPTQPLRTVPKFWRQDLTQTGVADDVVPWSCRDSVNSKCTCSTKTNSVFPTDVIPIILSYYDFSSERNFDVAVCNLMLIDMSFYEVINSVETINFWKFLCEEHFIRGKQMKKGGSNGEKDDCNDRNLSLNEQMIWWMNDLYKFPSNTVKETVNDARVNDDSSANGIDEDDITASPLYWFRKYRSLVLGDRVAFKFSFIRRLDKAQQMDVEVEAVVRISGFGAYVGKQAYFQTIKDKKQDTSLVTRQGGLVYFCPKYPMTAPSQV